MKTVTKALVASIATTLFILAGAAAADDVKTKVIELKAVTGKDVNVKVIGDSNGEVITLDQTVLDDEYLLAEKLAHLDDNTRALVEKTLQGLKDEDKVFIEGLEGEDVPLKKMVFLHSKDSRVIEIDKGEGLNRAKHGKLLVFNSDKDYTEEVHLKGVTDAIVRMINMGDFEPDELDEIQAALDEKR